MSDVEQQRSVGRTLVVACAALTRELRVVLAQIGGGNEASFEVVYLPSPLHNRPERIPAAVNDAVRARLAADEKRFDRIVLAYADCGTGGLLDAEMERLHTTTGLPVTRLPGAHCYEFFAGSALFASLHDDEPGTFYLTDYLAKHFDALVWSGLGLDRHPTLRDTYFGNYRRVVLLSQADDPAVTLVARAAADRLGLAFEHRHVGLDPFVAAMSGAINPTTHQETP